MRNPDYQPQVITSYRIINIVFAGIIMLILAYSFIFGTHGRNYPVGSAIKLITSTNTISTGLSRSFTAIMHGKFHEAAEYNRYGIRLFIFIIIQLFMRMAGLVISLNASPNKICRFGYIDIFITIVLFALFFLPFIKALINQ